MGKTVCFGEIMMRLDAPGNSRFLQADSLDVSFAGAEANVAVSLEMLHCDSSFVSRVPPHDIGQASLNALRRYGVDTSYVSLGGNRLGVYFVEKGASVRNSTVIYDRKYSSFSESGPEDYDWDRIFDGAEMFLFSGITVALGGRLPEICSEAVRVAKAKGITVCCDINYRSKLWSVAEASRTMDRYLRETDICIANEAEIRNILGIVPDSNQSRNVQLEYLLQESCRRYCFKTVAATVLDNRSASDNVLYGCICDGIDVSFSKSFDIHVVDRIGVGDSFCAGILYGIHHGTGLSETVNFAAAAGAISQTIPFDFNLASETEIRALAGSDGFTDIRR